MKVIFHLDLDSYFVSAERTINHSLNGKPVVISTGELRSVVAAASYEAKKLGVYVPMPFYKIKQINKDIITISPNFKLYAILSEKVFSYIALKYTKKMEISSIDECYLDVTDVWQKWHSPIMLAKEMQGNIMKDLKLPCSIGIADNKFAAKMSTSINKPYGITVTKPGNFLKYFKNRDIIEFFGIGKSTTKKLANAGFLKIGDLANATVAQLHPYFGSKTKTIIKNANGNGNDTINPIIDHLKSISHSITFMKHDLNNKSEIIKIISYLTKLVSSRAKIKNLVGTIISIKLKKTNKGRVKIISKQKTLKRAVNSYDEIFSEIVIIFNDLWNNEIIKFVGVSLSKLSNIFETTFQISLFDNNTKKSKIEKIIRNINQKMGKKAVISSKEIKNYKVNK